MIRGLSLSLIAMAVLPGMHVPDDEKVSVLLHGARLFDGVVAGAGVVMIRLDDLARQIEGSSPRSRPLLTASNNIVLATESGGCSRCLLTVKRPGAIGPIRQHHGERHVALDDISRALGAKTEIVARSVYSLTCPAGECFGGILGSVP